jgi:predicted transposase/invertase (TIGR01784 family)
MVELRYKLTNDVLFKMLFVQYPKLLERLVAGLLAVPIESIGEIKVRNTDMPPEVLGGKFCRLDLAMTVAGQLVDLEIQVNKDEDYPERTLYYWAREYSSALPEGEDYSKLPRTIVISIVAFQLFDCKEFHSEFRPLEVTRGTLLTDRMSLHYFELIKLPEVIDANDELNLWLALFKATTEEELKNLENIGGEVMTQAVKAYRHVSATEEFMMLERMRDDARRNEASALANAERKGREEVLALVEQGYSSAEIKGKLGF